MAQQPVRPPQLEPSIIVIFGITGDLSQRYLLPALYHLIKDNLLPEQTEIVGISRHDITTDQLYADVELCINEVDQICDPVALKAIHQRTRMVQMDLDDDQAYAALKQTLDQIEAEKGLCLNRLYYLSIPPQVYRPIVTLLGENGLNASCQHGQAMTRLLVEKPFGFDLTSARELIEHIGQFFGEEQVFRIDHYLAKETVQNILTFRFQNPIFESIWNSEHIASIDISAAEKIGIEGRAVFYEPLGALRDFIQSHLLQIAAIIAMDQPDKLDSKQIHASKQAVMQQMLPVPPDKVSVQTRRGQYKGYRAEVKNENSTTETFAAIQVFIDSPRWRNVSLNIWTGKALDEKKTEVNVNFHGPAGEDGNRLRFRIQPNEGIELDLLAKKPGFADQLQEAVMDFSYRQGSAEHPNAYERVLVDAVRGDHTLFATDEEVLAAWRVVQPVLDQWQKGQPKLQTYEMGAAPETLLQ
jgi:glucose-6-phosphate 1-dehydrogenase